MNTVERLVRISLAALATGGCGAGFNSNNYANEKLQQGALVPNVVKPTETPISTVTEENE